MNTEKIRYIGWPRDAMSHTVLFANEWQKHLNEDVLKDAVINITPKGEHECDIVSIDGFTFYIRVWHDKGISIVVSSGRGQDAKFFERDFNETADCFFAADLLAWKELEIKKLLLSI